MKSIVFIFLIFPIVGIAQHSGIAQSTTGEGIHFQSGLSWQEIKDKAKAEGKFIFMDCYTTWCGPCRFMRQNILPQEEVGKYMNEHFISVAVQMDKTKQDNEDIRKWYPDADSLAAHYSIESFPTFLFFTPDGHVLHRVIGATGKDPADFIAKVKDALDPDRQYYTLIGSYRMHLHDSAFLRRALILAIQSDDEKNAEEISDAFVEQMSTPYSLEDINLVRNALLSTKDNGFTFFLQNASRVDSIVGRADAAEGKISKIIAGEYVLPKFAEKNATMDWQSIVGEIREKYPMVNAKIESEIYEIYENEIIQKELSEPLYKEGIPVANWASISRHIRKKYPGYNPNEIIAEEKPKYYTYKKMWRESDSSALYCLIHYGSKFDRYYLNQFLWAYVFLHSTNRALLLKAIELSRQTVPDISDTAACRNGQNCEFMDTYANLLYKVGEKERAILWEKAALDAAQNSGMANSAQLNFKITLERMGKGKNTWLGRSGPYEEYR
jgi:thioredoxin-related protein